MAHDVFISYSSHDKSVADGVCASLENRRIRCWIAPRDVLPGVPYAEALIDGLNQSRLMVLVFSNNSNTSPQVVREVERAVNKAIPIIPFRIENVVPSKAMEYFVSSSHWLDALTPPLERHLQRLADTVQVLLSGGDTSLAGATQLSSATPVVQPKAKNKGLPFFIVAGSVVVALAVIGIIFLTGGFGRHPLGPGVSTPPASVAQGTTAPPNVKTPATPPLTESKGLLYQSDFKDASQWVRLSDDSRDSNYQNGEYSLNVKKWGGDWVINKNAGKFSDISMEIDARLVSGSFQNAYGLIFRAQNSDNFYRFLVSGQGEYILQKRMDDVFHVVQKYSKSPFINPGNLANHLRVVCKGAQIALECNGHELVSMTDSSFSDGFVGVAVTTLEPPADANFSNIKIYSSK